MQTRHPGFYYEQAAQYALQRKNLVKDMYKVSILYYYTPTLTSSSFQVSVCRM